MAGIYIHIPFCRQACHYCDFHFSTSLKYRDMMVRAICRELELREDELSGTVETIYFGGGTPSLFDVAELERITEVVKDKYPIAPGAEITLEANPDDLTTEKIEQLAASAINRLSIGVQSFFDQDLRLMNRAHDQNQAVSCIERALGYFENLSIDLIYGLPEMSLSRWKANLDQAFDLGVPHLSCYALTVEPQTALRSFIDKGVIPPVSDDLAREHYELLLDLSREHGFVNYEFSNFGKEGYFSRNNTAYWTGKPYLGIGPSAHSFSGVQRSWNIAHNIKYIKQIEAGDLPLERETLTPTDRYNEYVMTRLRTIWGISLEEVERDFGPTYRAYLLDQAAAHIEQHLLYLDADRLKVSRKGKFLSDGLAADLFLLNLKAE